MTSAAAQADGEPAAAMGRCRLPKGERGQLTVIVTVAWLLASVPSPRYVAST
jgi:hypothetical protein